MLDRLYKETQALLNKAQMGYLPPHRFNLFVNGAVEIVYGWLVDEVRRSKRRRNWGLHGKNYGDYSEFREELLEHFTEVDDSVDVAALIADPTPSGVVTDEGIIALPQDYRYFLSMYRNSDFQDIDKVDYKEFSLMKRNNYVRPSTECKLVATRRGNTLRIMPRHFSFVDGDKLTLSYLRRPSNATWAYQEVDDEVYYDAGSSVDVDMPDALYDELLVIVAEKAGLSIRDRDVVNQANTEQVQQAQNENRD